MEDKGYSANDKVQLIQSVQDRKLRQYNYIPFLKNSCTGMTFSTLSSNFPFNAQCQCGFLRFLCVLNLQLHF